MRLESMETQPTTPTRRKPSSKTRRDLQATIAQIDALFPTLADKPSKQADILCEKSSAIKTLLNLEVEDRETEQDTRIKELEAGHEADACRIAELETQNDSLRDRQVPKTVTIPDPEHAAVRRQNSELTRVLKFIAANIGTEHQRAQMAVRIIQSCTPETAKFVVPFLGFDYIDYARMLLKTEHELLQIISSAQREGPCVIAAKAILAVRDAAVPKAVEPPDEVIPDTRSVDEKLLEAKEVARQCWGTPALTKPSLPIPSESSRQESYRDAVDRKIFSGTVVANRPTPGDDLFS
jgi:hypothetical protein